ncbi:hypothetical protein BGX33_007525 [Mortierella sp. NVP41]|nr:hypothetical protein BGX33_007525 [Mortierella sp. NVP41]
MNTVVDAISRVSAASSPAILSLIHQLTRKNLPKLLGVYILLYIFKYRRTALGVEPRSDLRGPKGLPLLGDTVLVTLHSQNESLQLTEKLHEKYGPTYAFTIPLLGRILQFKDPAVLEQVLKTNFWAYEKGPEMQHTLHDLLGLGIFSADGHHWNWQRKMASNIFNVRAFRNYTSDVFVKEANVMADYLGAMADEGKTVDIHKLLYLYTLDSFGEISFGQTFGCMNKPDEEVEFAAAFDRLNTTVFYRIFTPGWQIFEWWSGQRKRIAKDKKIVTDFALNVIRERREHGYDKPQKDLLQLCMDQHGDDDQPLSDEMLKDMVLNFIIAGRDTTAQALSWMFYLLFRSQTDPNVFKKLVQEVDDVLKGQVPTYESCKVMKYAEACVPTNMKLAVQDDVWPDGTKIYKGEYASWSSWAMGRDTEIWGPDAKEFNPDRWMQGEKFSAHKFPAFHAGPRTCLGQQFATVEAITLMGILFQRLTFALVDPDNEPGYVPGLTLPMADGLHLRVKHRA